MTFEDWADDLELRLNQWLAEHPEEYSGEAPEEIVRPKRGVITVNPDPRREQWWCVYEDGIKRMAFFGSDAQQRATKWAADFLNGLI